jgi:hypothetical protein
MTPAFDLAFDRNNWQFRTDGFIPGWQRAPASFAVMRKVIAGMRALGSSI